MNMKLYEVGYWSYEEAPSILLTNEKDYTKEQFDDLVIEAVKSLLPKIIKKHKILEDVDFEYCYEDVAKYLQENYGFKIVEPDVAFKPFGWASITKKDDWECEGDEDINKLRDALNKL